MPPLSFLAPWFLVGAAAAAVPVVLHLFARQTAITVPFSAVHLLQLTPVEQTRRRRIADLLLLLLRMAILVLLALAFARPYLPSGVADGRLPLTIVAVDTSASMGAPATWAAARDRAREAIDGAPPGSLVALVVFDAEARLVVEPTADRGAVRSAVDRLEPGAGPTQLGPALDLTRTLAAGRQAALVVVSDTPASFVAESRRLWLPESVDLRIRTVAPPDADLRVVSLRRLAAGIAALVEAEGTESREVSVVLALDGREVRRQVVTVKPSVAVEVLFDTDLPASGLVAARVEDPLGRPAGNERFLVLDPRTPHRVLVVHAVDAPTDVSLYARAALDAEPSGAFATEVSAANDPALGSADWMAATSAVVVLGTRGIERRGIDQLAAFVRQGGGLLVAAGASTEAPVLRDLVGRDVAAITTTGTEEPRDAHLVVSSWRHPLVAAFGDRASTLGEVKLTRATPLVAPEADVVLHLSSGWPALVQVSVDAGRVLLFASDLSGQWNDFPKHAAFVPFLSEAVRFAARLGDARDSLEVGDTPEAVQPGAVTVRSSPRRVAVNVPAEEFGQPLLDAGQVERLVNRRAVELLPPTEAREEESRAPLWRLVLLTALAVIVIEGIVSGARSRRAAGVAP